jgi:hypothetical protein
MKSSSRLLAGVLIASAVTAPVADAVAATAPDTPAAARFYAFVGHWKGLGQISEPGHAPTALTLAFSCSKASAGWAVRCEMMARNDKLMITESDLMGVDPATGTGHWYAVTNQGETHDHVAEWSGAKAMKARHTWTQDGKNMEEDIAFAFTGNKAMDFRSVVREDGKEVAAFSGRLLR